MGREGHIKGAKLCWQGLRWAWAEKSVEFFGSFCDLGIFYSLFESFDANIGTVHPVTTVVFVANHVPHGASSLVHFLLGACGAGGAG